MYVLCIARHKFLSDHICRLFSASDWRTVPAVGFEEGLARAREQVPDVVICDYDLLATAPLQRWERDDVLADVPMIAVSMTRRPEEAHLLDVNGIAGFLYLPMIELRDALAVVKAAATGRIRPPRSALRWDTREGERRAEPR